MNRIAKFTLVVIAVFALAYSPTVLLADTLTPVAPGSNPGDWSQEWLESGAGLFNQIDLFLETPGVTFFPPGLTSASGPWNEIDVNPQFAYATFGATNLLYFFTNFTPDPSVPLTFDFYALLNGNVVDSATAAWDGSNWTIEADGKTIDGENMATPEPASLALLGTGLLGLALVVFRKASKPTMTLSM
jgi:hypothetical protein